MMAVAHSVVTTTAAGRRGSVLVAGGGGTIAAQAIAKKSAANAVSAHAAHVAHLAHVAQLAKAKATATKRTAVATKSKAATKPTTLDAHQLHIRTRAYLQGQKTSGRGPAPAGATSSPITPPASGGVVGPISSTTSVGATGTSLSSRVFKIAEYAAIILFLIWAWRKGYIQAALKRAGKLGANSGDMVAHLGKGKRSRRA